MKVKIGFIGCGGIANAHMERLAQIEDVEFVAMCDIEKEKAERAAQKYGGKVYTGFEKMLEEVKMDACYICVPPFAHKGQEEMCIEKNIHFFVEKPVHLDLSKAEEISSKVKAAGLITGVGYVLRYFDVVEEAREIISKERIAFARGRYYGGVPGEGKNKWLITKSLSGGQLVEQATHIVNMMQYFLGDVEEVFAYKVEGINNQIYPGYDVEDASSLLLKFKDGYIGNLTCTWLWSGFNSGVEVMGKGIILDYQGNTLTVDRGNKKTISISSIDPMLEEEKAFIKAVAKGDGSYVKSDYADAVKTLAVTLKAHESIRTGKPVRL
ncbi:MAG TPA: Gfo/Idh/MocA family oxidoreductase [bacterium]|nr:Gfo/Idh/MocA family oxidoreductase [bacterium]HPP29680.1 Gfo/Idh/MocA family oxidoreductase [bacterium]